jgi:hypothetical protein
VNSSFAETCGPTPVAAFDLIFHAANSEEGQRLARRTTIRPDETVDVELSLEELEQLTGGVGLVDAMVSSSVLMLIVSQSAGLFGQSMNALSKGRLRDGLNAAINADMELVRKSVAEWASDTSMGGQLTYAPDPATCDAGTLGKALLADPSSGLSTGTSPVLLNGAPTPLQGISIERTVAVDPSNPNLIHVSYATNAASSMKVEQNATLATPAQGWCA